jgi:transposase
VSLVAGRPLSVEVKGTRLMIVLGADMHKGSHTIAAVSATNGELDIRRLVDHRERLVRMRVALYNDLLWHLHDLSPELSFPGCALLSKKWTTRIARRLGRAEQTARVRIARDELGHLRELTHTIDSLEAEIADLVAQVAPQLLAEPGFGPLTAGKLIGEIARAQRFTSDAKLARAGGIAPIPVSSGRTNRHRLDRAANGQINTAIHRVAITRARCHPETKAYLERKRAEGKTNRDAIRCLKRHLVRRIWHILQPPPPDLTNSTNINLLT